MPTVVAEHAVVIGAGMGGLAAAKAVAPYFNKVSVLDRDALPEGPDVRPGPRKRGTRTACLPEARRRSKRCSPALEATC
jgi:flavin-dependent dehydrogenase